MPSFATFSDADKVRIRMHTGYTNASSVATAVLGTPSSIETMFIIELAMNQCRLEAQAQVLRHLDIMDTIETQMVDDLELLSVTQVEEISIRQDEQDKLVGRYLYWQGGLCNLLGIEPCYFDKRFSGGSGINVTVNH